MKAIFIKYRLAAQIFTLIFFVFFIFILPANAQKNETVNKDKPKKATRVFYGQASFYANKFNGRRTASGETFDQKKFTCACNVLPLGTWVKVTNLRNKRTVLVKINDRIHPKMKRVVDLSRAAAQKLGYISSGLTRVKGDNIVAIIFYVLKLSSYFCCDLEN
jgi:rare lipoprotein A